jgi:hypothetical protein
MYGISMYSRKTVYEIDAIKMQLTKSKLVPVGKAKIRLIYAEKS